MSIDDSDIYHCYVDLWKGPSERFVMAYQGIGKDNVFKHRIGAADAASNDEDQAIATAFGKRLCIPLDFELLCGRALVRAHIYKTPFVLGHMSFYQAGLGGKRS